MYFPWEAHGLGSRCRCSGWRAEGPCSPNQCGNDKQVFPRKQGALSLCGELVKGTLLLSQGELERGNRCLLGVSWKCQAECSQFRHCGGRGEKNDHGLCLNRSCSIWKLSNRSTDDACRQKALKLRTQTKATKIQGLVTPQILQHKSPHIALKKQDTKRTKEEASECAELLTKRMKEQMLAVLAGSSTSESSQKQGIFKSNK